MGQAIASLIEKDAALTFAGFWRRAEDLNALLQQADVIIDFSLPEGTEAVAEAVARHGVPLVCGVSGLNEEQFAKLRAASADVAVVYDRNMSLGVAVLTRSVREAAASLGTDFEVSIAETHHIHKKDAPSGTALLLGEAIADARGEPGTGSISFESERRGEVPGDHDVVMSSATETLTFGHSVTTREVFADGALRAARWISARPAGLYGMQDVLFSEIG